MTLNTPTILTNLESELQIYLDNTPTPLLAYWDKNLICRFANNAYLNTFKTDYKRFVNVIYLPDLFGTNYSTIQAHVEDVLAGNTQQFTKKISHSDGTISSVFVNYHPDIIENEVNGFYVHAIDISNLVVAEEKNDAAKKALTKAHEIGKIGEWHIDNINKTLVWNDLCKEIHGAPLTFTPTFDNVLSFYENPNNYQSVEELMAAYYSLGVSFDVEVHIKTIDGKKKWARIIGNFETDVNNNITKLLGIIQDIHESKTARYKLDESNKELRSLLDLAKDQNDRLKNYSAIVSHNLKSHASNIQLISDLFKEINKDKPITPHLRLLETAARNLNDALDNLNDVVLMDSTLQKSLIPINIYESIEKKKSTVFQIYSKAAIEIINEVPNTVFIDGIQAYIDSILLNLITNSINYRDPNKKIYIKIKAVETKLDVQLIVSDNGLGIDLIKHKNQLFKMYSTFHGNGDARGIGLFITKNQIESLGGKIEVNSELNIGTTFTISFKKHHKPD